MSEDSIRRGLRYLKSYAFVLIQAEKQYGVDPFTIVSIIRNETNLGNYIRKDHLVMNTLHSLYVLMPQWRKFAARELSCFLKAVEENGWNAFEIPGSNRGAFGYPQFLPCSFLQFAADGNGDGVIDLFSHSDAIMSVARYLSRNGWSDQWDDQYLALRRYNHHGMYHAFVYEYREKLMRVYFTSTTSIAN